MTLNEVIERIRLLASNIGGGIPDARLLSTEVISEILLPRVFEIVTQNAVKDPDNLNSLRKDHTIAVANGVGTLPESIKEEFASSIFISDVSGTNISTKYWDSYAPQYQDYYNDSLNSLVGQFTVRNRQFYYYPSGRFSTKTTGSSALISLNAIPVLNHGFTTALRVQTSGGNGFTNELFDGVDYFVIPFTANTIKLASSAANATAGTALTVTPDGVGTFDIVPQTAIYCFTGNVTINSITIPTLPTAVTDTVVIKDNLLEEVIVLTANFISGKTKIPGLDYPDLTNG